MATVTRLERLWLWQIKYGCRIHYIPDYHIIFSTDTELDINFVLSSDVTNISMDTGLGVCHQLKVIFTEIKKNINT